MELPGASATLQSSYARAAAQVLQHPVHAAVHRAAAVERVLHENALAKEVASLDYKLSNNSLALLPDYGFKLSMLKAANFVSSEEVRSSLAFLALSRENPIRLCG